MPHTIQRQTVALFHTFQLSTEYQVDYASFSVKRCSQNVQISTNFDLVDVQLKSARHDENLFLTALWTVYCFGIRYKFGTLQSEVVVCSPSFACAVAAAATVAGAFGGVVVVVLFLLFFCCRAKTDVANYIVLLVAFVEFADKSRFT